VPRSYIWKLRNAGVLDGASPIVNLIVSVFENYSKALVACMVFTWALAGSCKSYV
jgi:hypothetical protein